MSLIVVDTNLEKLNLKQVLTYKTLMVANWLLDRSYYTCISFMDYRFTVACL